MIAAHLAHDIRAAEQRWVADQGTGPSAWDTLMHRAAMAVADIVDREIPRDAVPVVLVGPGNNGGDGLFAAALLCERGRRVTACLVDPQRVHRRGLEAATAAGVRFVDGPQGHHWAVDALFGLGSRAGLQGRAAHWAQWQRDERPWTCAIDFPSGVDADNPGLTATAMRADLTVTFGSHKLSLLVPPAAELAGRVVLADLGLAAHLNRPALTALEPSDGPRLIEHWSTVEPEHKYTRGVLGIAAGSAAYPGAAHLCVAGAQAGPAGMIRFIGAPDLAMRVVDRAPEVVAGRGRVDAWVVGPGSDDHAAEQLEFALADGVPVLVDASALACLPDHFDVPALLTPHAGELARMLDVPRSSVENDPWGYARQAADRWNAAVLLKGRRTLVVPPGGNDRPESRVNLTGTRWLATAGSGDVLAGLAGSLLAAGFDPVTAGSVGAYLHGAAAVRANPGGPVTASLVAAALPYAMAEFLRAEVRQVQDW